MFNEERKLEILSILKNKSSVSVDALSKALFVSPATIRRDLSSMEKAGLIKRSHGGAVLFRTANDEPSIQVRENENIKEKKIIAELAARFVSENNTIFMDSSSTVGAIIPYLYKFKYLSIITNGLKSAMLLSHHTDSKIFIAGGSVNNQSNSVIGCDTLDFIKRFRADICFISCSGLTLRGIGDTSLEQSNLKKTMLQNSATKILLCDSSKLSRGFLCETCTFSELSYIITDKKPDDVFIEEATKNGCEIIYPGNL